MNNLAGVLEARGKVDEAEPLIRQVVEARRRVLGGAPDTLQAMSGLALVLNGRGKLNEAKAINRQILEARRRILGPGHTATLGSINNLALVLLDRRRPAEAEPILRQLLSVDRTLSKDLPKLANTLSGLGRALTDNGKAREAEPLLHDALEIRRKVLPKGHWATSQHREPAGRLPDEAGPVRRGRATPPEQLSNDRSSLAYRRPGPAGPGKDLALYEAWGKPEKESEWRVKLMDLDFPADPFAP